MFCQIVYVSRMVDGQETDLLIQNWNWRAWNGCFCRIV